MGDEGSSVGQTAALELDEIDFVELEEVELPTSATAPAPGARGSVPPPVPPAAREARRPSAPPGSLPPPPPAALRVPSRSGMYRIDSGHRAAAPAAVDAAQLEQRNAALKKELRELRASNDRLRLTLRLREDRVRELARALQEQQKQRAELEAELSRLREQPQGDDLKRIPGIGPAFERALHAAGVTSFEQIAAWTADDVQRIASELKTHPARISRGNWIEHARTLASAGDADR